MSSTSRSRLMPTRSSRLRSDRPQPRWSQYTTVNASSRPRTRSKRRASLIIGRPGPCWISRSTGLAASAPRTRIQWVAPPLWTASSVSILIWLPFHSCRAGCWLTERR